MAHLTDQLVIETRPLFFLSALAKLSMLARSPLMPGRIEVRDVVTSAVLVAVQRWWRLPVTSRTRLVLEFEEHFTDARSALGFTFERELSKPDLLSVVALAMEWAHEEHRLLGFRNVAVPRP